MKLFIYAFAIFVATFSISKGSMQNLNDDEIEPKKVMTEKFVKDSQGKEICLGKYKHYKGDYYQVLGICKHTETQEELIHYRSLYGNYDFWVRPIKMFFEDVIFQNREQPRFTFIEHM